MPAVARAVMLIRKPVAKVFKAFVKPSLLKKFWLKRASAPLKAGAKVHWEFWVPGAVDTVEVTRFVESEEICFNWSIGKAVTMRFSPNGKSATVVEVKVEGFKGAKAVSEAIATTEGIAILLCDLKSLLESGKSSQLVRDKAKLIEGIEP